MNCPIDDEDNADVLLAYCARKLNAERVEILERHMSVCPECARFRDAQLAVWKAMDVWEAPPVGADFDRRLYARIEAADAAPWYRRAFDSLRDAFRPMLWQPAFPLAAAGVLVVAGFLLDHRADRGIATNVRSAQTPEIQVSITEVEQVERTLDDMEMLRQFDRVSKDGSRNSKTM